MSHFTLGVVNVGGGECQGGGMSHNPNRVKFIIFILLLAG